MILRLAVIINWPYQLNCARTDEKICFKLTKTLLPFPMAINMDAITTGIHGSESIPLTLPY